MSNGYSIWTVNHYPNGYPNQNLPYNGLLCRSYYSSWDDCLDRFTKQTSNRGHSGPIHMGKCLLRTLDRT